MNVPGLDLRFAKAWSPLLDHPVEGPVILRSSDHPLPDLVMDLKGLIDVNVVGRIDSIHARNRTTFEGIPDQPVSKFTLTLQGGGKGLLVNAKDLCGRKHRATVLIDGQNGATADQAPLLRNACEKASNKSKKEAPPPQAPRGAPSQEGGLIDEQPDTQEGSARWVRSVDGWARRCVAACLLSGAMAAQASTCALSG